MTGNWYRVRYLRPPRPERRRLWSGMASVLVHALLLGAMLSWGGGRPPGAVGPSAGAGLDVALISAASLGLAEPHAPPMNSEVASPPPTPPSALASVSEATIGAANAPLQPTDAKPIPPAPATPEKVVWANQGDDRVAGLEEREKRGAADTAGGDPKADSALLAQIAKCLPAQLRPHLPAHQLILKIGADGALKAAPVIDSLLPLFSAEDRAQADRVIQAALQCGPYRQAGTADRAITLAVDFSMVGAFPAGGLR